MKQPVEDLEIMKNKIGVTDAEIFRDLGYEKPYNPEERAEKPDVKYLKSREKEKVGGKR